MNGGIHYMSDVKQIMWCSYRMLNEENWSRRQFLCNKRNIKVTGEVQFILVMHGWNGWNARLSFSTILWKRKIQIVSTAFLYDDSLFCQLHFNYDNRLYGINACDHALQFWRKCHVTLLINYIYERNFLWQSSLLLSLIVWEKAQSRLFLITFLAIEFDITLKSVCSTFRNSIPS